jgi:hypothetical protein
MLLWATEQSSFVTLSSFGAIAIKSKRATVPSSLPLEITCAHGVPPLSTVLSFVSLRSSTNINAIVVGAIAIKIKESDDAIIIAIGNYLCSWCAAIVNSIVILCIIPVIH